MNRAKILDTAKATVTVDRAATHGNAEYSFGEIAGHWTWWLQSRLRPGEIIDAYDVAQMMVGFKQARGKVNRKHADNFVDQAGYSSLAGEIALREE